MKFDYKTTLKLITSAITLIVIACAVSIITLIFGGAKDNILNSEKTPTTPETSSCILGETPDYGQNYIDNIIFLGDGSIYGLIDSELLTNGSGTRQVWSGKEGDLPLDFSIDKATILYPESGKEISVSSAASSKKPEYILITLGINNGVSYCTEESFKAYYGKLISSLKEASPGSKIILQSILPVSKDYEKSTSGITVKKINSANEWVKDLAEDYTLRYLDTASVLKDKNGYLKAAYDSGNGVTLNTEGYSALLYYVRTHGYK